MHFVTQVWLYIATSLVLLRVSIHAQYPPQGRDRYRGNPIRGYIPAKLHPCEQSSCYPATGNLLIGREAQLSASSTCGLQGQQRYCIVSNLDADRKKCFWCDSRPTTKPNPLLNHNISNIVYKMYPGTRTKSWWQSENGKENVFIQLDLEAEFHFTHLIITFKTFRPAAMLIERSYDFGKSWHVYRYFAHHCEGSFPRINTGSPQNLTDVICESRYSGVAPSKDGEIIYRVLPPTVHIDNPYSEQVQNLLKMTNLRINFTRLHTLGDDLLDTRDDIEEKYYYAISEMVVRGSCSCYGHANRCKPLPGIDSKPDMVHGKCECTHNTKGRNCEKCEDFYNDLPWRPAIGKETHACKRCNCNNHATSCHFDPALYESTGKLSGGVCDGCQHNTQGPNCEQCKPFFFRDPGRDIQDPEVCKLCDCDPHGSLDGGICDSITDPVNNLEAGSCHCKSNVEGRRCDSCKNGFWNFTETNPDGCQACTCNTFGTIDNQGCNQYTGECTCKRYVTGRDCNQCLPEYWGLSEKKDGCQSCDCDPGGSIDNNCDVITGKCRCRDNLMGRTCNTSNQLYYIAALDYFLYEAELSPNTSNCQVVIKEPYRDGRENPWTGTGYLKNFENSYFLTYVNNIPKTTDYNIVIRYEPTLPYVWSEAVVTLIRPEKPDPKKCDRSQIEESQLIPLPPNSRQFVAHSEVCLEAGVPYTIKIEFRKYDTTKETPTASILIDSILLTPVIKKIPWFDGNNLAGLQRFEDFKRHQCDNLDYYLNPKKAPEACKNFYKSISADINNGGLPCQCDGTGSTSNLCNENGGNCTCKPNVVGRRCDRCAVGTYGFGPDGCKSCDCNSIGALDNFCNATTGQCKCRANTYGRECDQCRTGFWNFPNCMRCDCNGHAETCHPTTGECINCKDSTQGHYCHECVVGYYGEPKLNSDIPCRPCPCPGLANSNHSFATNCSLDPYTKDVVCQCHEAYTGPRCDLCSNNYYGNPEVQGGSCQSCDCNDKIDMLTDGNCDPHSGKCLKCLYETTGDHCEVCRANYFRYTKESFCEECNCNGLGTNKTAGFCDPESGQCPCLPNVSGLRCDGCIKDYWKIASGLGCERCDCDPLGSLDSQCNAFDGQCVCKPGFGGRQCSECTSLSWGDPKVECKSCQCNDWGSEHRQCDRKTGACVCRLGIGGYNCDTCARGYLGQFPNCQPCGECFDNWDRILQETRSNTTDLINRASNIKKVGARGAYTKEFDNMQSQLDDIKQLLNNTDTVDVDDINKDLSKLRERINDTEVQRMKLDDKLAETKEKMVLTDINLKKQIEEIKELNDKIKNLEKNGTELQADNVQGALNLIQNAQIKATEAEEKAEHTQKAISAAERQCKAAEALVNNTATTFKKSLENNKMKLEGIKNDLERLKGVLPDLNNLVCDGHGDPCDVICGGAGCNSCGNSVSCENGAKQQAEAALSLTNSAEVVLRNKEATANDFIRNISLINTNETRNTAQATYEQAEKAFKKFNLTLHDVDALKNDIQEFLDQNITENIKNITEEGKLILGKKINSLSQDEIDKLANDIKDIVNSLTNTSYIIDATKDDLLKVNKLKDDAANAKDKAAELLNEAKEVKAVLNNSTNKQKEAELAIEKALNDTDTVNQLLNEIDEKTRMAHSKTNTTADDINELANKLKQLESNITNNKIYADRVINESAEILLKAQDTTKNFTSLLDKYGKAKRSLETNNNIVKSLKERSKDLSNRAIQLKVKVDQTKHDMKSEIGDKIDPKALEQKILELNRQIGVHIENIRIKSNHYNNC